MDEPVLRITDVMTVDPIVVDVGATLEHVDRLLRASFITGLPVVDSEGKLVGVVTQTDLVRYRFARTAPSIEVEGAASSVT